MKAYIDALWVGGEPAGWRWVVVDRRNYTVAAGHRVFKTASGCRKEADRVLEALKKTKGKYT